MTEDSDNRQASYMMLKLNSLFTSTSNEEQHKTAKYIKRLLHIYTILTCTQSRQEQDTIQFMPFYQIIFA
jgi:hypothetical protein